MIDIGREVGRGQTGAVYHATDKVLSREVAVKFFHNPQAVGQKEVGLHVASLAALDHPNIVKVYSVQQLVRPGGEDAEPAIVMEWVPGERFDEWLTRSDITLEKALEVLESLLDGLEHLHKSGLAHGDLHAQNVRVSNSRAKLIDPMVRDPEVVRTTELEQSTRARDLHNAKWLMTQALSLLPALTYELGNLALLETQATSLDDLREKLRLAASRSGKTRDQVSATAGYYGAFRRAQARGNVVEWQQVRQSAIRSTRAGLRVWIDDYQGYGFTSLDELSDAFWISVGRCEGLLAMSLAAAQICVEPWRGDLRRFLALLDEEWPGSGYVTVTRHRQSVIYLLQHMVGAALFYESRAEEVFGLLETIVLDPDNKALPLWSARDMSSWPSGLGRNATDAWKVVLQAYERSPVLREVLPGPREYEACVTAYRLAIAALELVHNFAEIQQVLHEGKKYLRHSYPTYYYVRPEAQASAARMLFADRAAVDRFAESRGVDAESFRQSWPNYLASQSRVDPEHLWLGDHDIRRVSYLP